MQRAQVVAWLGMAASERPGGIILRGPAGIGKTAFCLELGASVRARNWRVVRVDAGQSGRPYAVVAALAERVIMAGREVLDQIGAPARSVLAQLSPVAAPAAELSGRLGRHQVIGALRRLFLAASGGGEVLVLVDDAHLLDDADVDVLVHLIASGPPVCVALAVRPLVPESALGRGVARLADGGWMQTLDLEPLADDETRRLAVQAAPNPLPEEVLAHIVHVAEGNPFATIELARCALPGGGLPLPRSAAEAILIRLCDVPAATLETLKWMALAGDAFDAATAAALSPDAEERSFSVLDAALASGVLVLSGARYRFRHDLVRQALIEQIPPHRRLKMHRQAAQRLQACLVVHELGAVRQLAMHQQVGDFLELADFRDVQDVVAPVVQVVARLAHGAQGRVACGDTREGDGFLRPEAGGLVCGCFLLHDSQCTQEQGFATVLKRRILVNTLPLICEFCE